MATATAPTTRAAAPPAPPQRRQPYRLSLDQYHRMAEAGILTTYDRIVLLDGLLVHKMTKGAPHSTSTQKAQKALEATLPAGWHVRKEEPIGLPGGPAAPDSEPEPDLAVVRGELGDYAARHPNPGDVALVVEVADSSLYEDRQHLYRYARAGIPVAWLVNLKNRTVEVYTDPTGPADDPRYRTARTPGEGEAIAVTIAGQDRGAIAVREIMP